MSERTILSRPVRFLIVFSLLVGSLWMLHLYNNEEHSQPSDSKSESAAAIPKSTQNDSHQPSMGDRQGAASSPSSFAKSAIWPVTEDISNPPQIRADVPDLSLYAFEREAFLAAREGDKLVVLLPSPVNETEMWVENATKNPSGSITLTGKINGYSDYSFVMTLGPKSTFATIGTREGVFNLRGDTQYMWVGLARKFNHHVDPSKPDYRINH